MNVEEERMTRKKEEGEGLLQVTPVAIEARAEKVEEGRIQERRKLRGKLDWPKPDFLVFN